MPPAVLTALAAPPRRPPSPTARAAPSPGPGGNVWFDLVAYTGVAMDVGFEHAVVIDLATLKFEQRTPLLFDHISDIDFVVGQSAAVRAVGRRLMVSGFVIPVVERARQVIDLARGGYQWQVSIGADPGRLTPVRASEEVKVNGLTHRGPILVGYGAKLREVSFVSLGADASTSAAIAAPSGSDAVAARGAPRQPTRRAKPNPVVRRIVADRLARAIRAGMSARGVAVLRNQLRSLS